ncbi:hypothetical protein [Archangium sp.]|uniref:hypothetical protein n=1 Tax=Archangium sp. TaxID=1872627 RepID=UPI002D5E5097|nr:hypothetical protein [Archangium sp.]HYO53787.1 hypothetical protein [Archangium sp.]
MNKKIRYTVQAPLLGYLRDHDRIAKIPLKHVDLLRFTSSIPLMDTKGQDTLWETVFYSSSEMKEINGKLKEIYALLKTAGDISVMEHLYVERIDFCAFGNSQPFRVKIVNHFNDNHDYFYLKVPDASRVYGLELEHILSPNRINYLINEETLIEEHIIGIPGDQFIERNLKDKDLNQIRLGKEFVKFNERCFVRLLGDMRSYNFVIDMTADFDDTQFRFRAIDFDQQCYEGRKSIYLPQYFEENQSYVELCVRLLNAEVVKQYQQEERALIGRRVKSSRHRLNELLGAIVHDEISTPEKTEVLRAGLARHYSHPDFMQCRTMGEMVKESLRLLLEKNERTQILP